MPKPDSAFVHCICCTRGPKGDKSCAAAYAIGKAWEPGCFLGVLKPRKHTENTRYNDPGFKKCSRETDEYEVDYA